MATRFNFVKRGYDPSEVDEQIETLESVIKSYKEKDTAIKNAILNAQIAADNIVQNAKNEAAEIRSKAFMQIEEIINSVTMQKELLNEFQVEYNAQIEKYLHKINNEDIGLIYEKINKLEKYAEQFSSNNKNDQL